MARRKKKPEKAPSHERWLVSYADFITLLFAVFVTLFAMSQTDKRKVEEVIASLRESFGYTKSSIANKANIMDSTDLRAIPSLRPEAVNMGPLQPQMKFDKTGKDQKHAEDKDFKTIKSSLEAYLIKHGMQDKVKMEIDRRGLVISLKEAGFFDSGSAFIKISSYPMLGKVAESLSQYNNSIRVEGHTDNVPIVSREFKSNWELSTARATNIVHHFINYYKFDPSKMSATGYGEFRPVENNDTADGRAKNRRVNIVVLSDEGEKGEPEAVAKSGPSL
ncbi:MAG TPA: flagellar motor protein MotB [Geobacteraceae bacterium]|nr:flagellar motor protein MotB [Geobacteraceae bacterium]